MLSFKDFLAVSYTQQTDQQDLNAKKRHRGVVGEEAPTQEDPEHKKKLEPDPASPAQLRKAGKQ